MYKIKYNDEYIFKFNEPKLSLESAVLYEEINKITSLTISFNSSNINANKIEELNGEIIIIEKDTEIFRGRCIDKGEDFYKNEEITVEGTLAYLKDTLQDPYLHQGSINAFLEYLLGEHNKKVSEHQKIYKGNVTVVDSNDYIRRESQNREKTYNIIQEKLIKTHGGFLNVRRTNERNYIDYLADYGESDQKIRFCENLMDLTRYTKSENISTVFYAKGAEKEDGTYTTIESENNGKPYIIREDLKEKYGWIEEEIEWEDVTEPANLLKKLKEYASNVKEIETIELSAVDARLLGADVKRIVPGQKVRVISKPHGIDKYFICQRKETNLLEPDESLIYLGNEYKTFTGTINNSNTEIKDEIKQTESSLAEEIKNTKEEFSNAIKNANGLFHTNVKQSDGSVITYLHNKQNLSDSDIQIVVNSVGIAVSSDAGKNWYGLEVDGDLIAKILTATGIKAEWVRTGTMLANRISGGELVLGGENNTNGILQIKDSNGKVIGTWGKDGIIATKGSFSGEIISERGKIGNWIITNRGLYSSMIIDGKEHTVFMQPYQEDIGEGTWIFSVQESGVGKMIIKGDGSIYTASGISCDDIIIRGKIKQGVTVDGNERIEGHLTVQEHLGVAKELYSLERVTSFGDFTCKGKIGITGTYTIGDKTITVTGGIITSIS